MKNRFLLIIFISVILMSFRSDKPAYKLFNTKGKEVKYKNMIKKLKDADIVFFGELHNNTISHWLEIEITKDLFEHKKKDLLLGAEMFEADNQLIMDEYLASKISKKSFEKEIRLWNNYKTDYKPLVEFAKKNNLKFIATNIPRRYASIVYKKGFEGIKSLSSEAKKYIATLPIIYDSEVSCYKEMLKMGAMMGKKANDIQNFPKSQAIKDATMSHFILKHWKKGKLFLHYNGSYHSDKHEGIVWYLKKANPKLKILTITTVTQKNIDKPDDKHLGKADYILCVPESMTKTY